jgi:hypothetical protein
MTLRDTLQELHAQRLDLGISESFDESIKVFVLELNHDVFWLDIGVDKAADVMQIDEANEHLSRDQLDKPKFHSFFPFVEVLNQIKKIRAHKIEDSAVMLSVHSKVDEIVQQFYVIGLILMEL